MQIYLTLLLILNSFLYLSCEINFRDKPEFRILSPQFMCNSKDTNTSIESPPEKITIRFQPKEGKKLTYLVRVYFEFIEGWKSQRHTISLWRSIRMLEKRIRNTSEEISMNNQIHIDQKELTPGVIYTFNIGGRDSIGDMSDEKNVTVVYRADSAAKSKRDISLLLIGSVYMYSHLPLLIQANLIFCEPTNDYVFKWDMQNLEEEHRMWLKTPGKTLYLPPNIVKPTQQDRINVQVLNTNRTEIYTQSTMKLHILKRDFFAILTPMNLSIGIDRRILYKLSISQMDVDEYPVEVSWDCEDLLNSNDTRCVNFEGSSSHKQEVFFIASGIYRITAIITYQELTQELSSYVTVDPRIIASVQFPNLKPEPLVSWRSLRVPVIVNNVIPLCHLQWSTVNLTEDPRYGFIDRSYFPSQVIPDLEKNFLSDIVEISNATYSEDFPLEVPAGSEDFAGIEPEKIYVFRLLVTCPEPIREWDSESEGNVTSYTDLILSSKQAPIAKPLQVFPEEGTALKTLFTMFTGTATDTPDDYPLRYLFQYQIGSILVDLEEYYENTEIITELPYSEEPIRIFYRVCDTRNACSRTEGPPIRVNLTEDYSDKEFQFKLEKIKSMIFRTDYTNMFSTSISCIFTFKAFSNKKFYDRLRLELLQEIQKETGRLETFKSEDMFISELKILSFVKYSKILAELLGDRSIKLKEKLLNLLNSIPQSRSDDYGPSDESNLVMKRSIDEESFEERNLSEDDFLQKGILELQLREAIINSQNSSENSEENLQLKQNFTQQVRDFIANLLCPSMQLSSEYKLVSSDFLLEIYRGNGFQAQTKNFSLPASPSGDKISNGYVFLRNVFDIQPTEEYCASRIAYSSDFLTGDLSQEIISVDLFEIDSELNSARILEPGKDDEKFSVISFQLSNERYPEELKCVVWNGEMWTDEYCLILSVDASSIECQCSTLGFVKLFSDYRYEYSEDFSNVTTTTELIETTPTTLTISSTNEIVAASESAVNDPPVDYILKSNVIQTESLVITTDIKQTAKSVSDMFTFSPIVNKGTEEVVSVTTTIQKNSSEPTDDHEEIVRESSYSSLIGFIVIGVFCLIIILMLSLNLYFMRKKRKMKHLQELQIMSTEARTQSEEIKYARFYDEQMLSGN